MVNNSSFNKKVIERYGFVKHYGLTVCSLKDFRLYTKDKITRKTDGESVIVDKINNLVILYRILDFLV